MKNFSYIFFVISVIFLGLQLPVIYMIPLALFTIYFALRAQQFNAQDWLILFILFLFCFFYSLISSYYGYKTPLNSLKESIYMLCSYISFRLLPYSQKNLKVILLALISSTVFFIVASAYTTLQNNPTLLLLNRQVIGYWNGIEYNTPLMGSFLIMGLSLPVIALLKSFRKSLFNMVMLGTIFIVSLYSAFLFQGRAPIFSALIIFSFISYYMLSNQSRNNTNFLGISFLVFFSIALLYSPLTSDYFINYQDRFNNIGFESDRYRSWLVGLINFFAYPLGGKQYEIGAYYIHNTFLDLNYELGIVPTILLFILFCFFLKDYLAIMKRKSTSEVTVLILILGASLSMPLFFEPVITGSLVLFQLWLASMGLARMHIMRKLV